MLRIKAGALGYILKGAETSDLIQAVRVVARGEVFLYPPMAQKLVNDYLNFVHWGEGIGSNLTPREKEILRLFSEGLSTTEIAEKLVISSKTVKVHISNILNKLDLQDRTQLAIHALKCGWADTE